MSARRKITCVTSVKGDDIRIRKKLYVRGDIRSVVPIYISIKINGIAEYVAACAQEKFRHFTTGRKS